MTTEDQKLTNGSVKPADDPRKYSVNAGTNCAVRHCWFSAFTMQKFTNKDQFHQFALDIGCLERSDVFLFNFVLI